MAGSTYKPWESWGGLAAGVYGKPLHGYAAELAKAAADKKKHKPSASDAPSLGYIIFESYDPNYSFIALLGVEQATITAGLGGWTKQSRPRRRSITEWQGIDPLSIDIPILFDNYASGDGLSTEHSILQLELMAALDSNDPPLLLFNSGGVVQHDYHDDPQRDWIIEDIKWGSSDRNEVGNRTRQECVVSVIQYDEDDRLSTLSPAKRHASATKGKGKAEKGAKHKWHVVKNAGETLESIAAAELHNANKWHTLRKLNPKLRDPKKILPIGTVVKLK